MAKRPFPEESGTSSPSLGDAICGEPEKARKRCADYAKETVIGSGYVATDPSIHGEDVKAAKYFKGIERSLINGTVTAGTVALTSASGSVAGTKTADLLDGDVSRDYVGGALFGGIAGDASGALQAKAYNAPLINEAKINVAKSDASYLKQAEKDMEGKNDTAQTLMTYETEDGTRGHALGFSAKERAKMYEQVKDKDGKILSKPRSANYAGSPSYPKGYDNVSRIFEDPDVQKYLQEHGREMWPYQNCSEHHALETIKAKNPGATIISNYTLEADELGNISVKAPCKNCAAAGDHYGSVPFAKYDKYTVDDAIKAYIREAREENSE